MAMPHFASGQPAGRNVIVLPGARGSFLGVSVVEVSADRARELKLKEERGAEVTRVSEGSPAEKAGLRVNDVVLEYNGQRVEGTEQFVRLVRETPAGRKVDLTVSREGQTQTLSATIAARSERFPETQSLRIPEISNLPLNWGAPVLGIEAESLTPQLAAYFGVKDGVLVRSVNEGSAAGKAGIKAGDVITKVDGKDVSSPMEVARVLRSATGTAPVTVVREKREMELSVAVDAQRRPFRPRGDFVRFFDRGQ
jgi:serine protease Do